MKYWLFQHNQVLGPFDREQLAGTKGFSSESLVCPEGRKGTEMGDWQRAGIVADLAGVLLKAVPVATATRSASEMLLPPDPTLRDLAVLGTLQEKTSVLENAVSQLQEDLHGRDTELSRLKVELASKERSLQELQTKVGELEGRVISLSSLKDEVAEKLNESKEELRRDLEKTQAEGKSPFGASPEDQRISELADRLSNKERQLEAMSSRLSEQERRLEEMQSRSGPAMGSLGGATAAPLGGASISPLGNPAVGSASGSTLPPLGSAAGPERPAFALPTGLDQNFTSVTEAPSEKLPPVSPLSPLSLTPAPAEPASVAEPAPVQARPAPFPTPPPAFVSFSDPIVKTDATGLTDLSGGAEMPKLDVVPEIKPTEIVTPLGKSPAGKSTEPEDMVSGKAIKKKSGANNKVLIAAVVVALAGAGGAMLLLGKKRISVKNASAPVPELAPSESLPPPASPISQNAAPPQEQPPTDPALAAVDLAKAFVIPGTNLTLAQRLETTFPPDPKNALSPWMVEKIDGEDKYQVNYYTHHDELVYQFLVRPQEKMIEGMNPPAVAVLNGEAPSVPVKKAKAGKGKKAAAAKVAKPRRKPASAGKDVPSASQLDNGQPSQESQSADQKSIDELLLPGMSKPVPPAGSKAKDQSAQGQPAGDDGIPPADQLGQPINQ